MNNNNYVLPIPKDLKKIQSKLFFGLTKRQLIGFGIGIVIGLIAFMSLKGISLDAAMYGLFFTVAPIFFATIFQKDGMYLEKWIKLIIEQNYLNPPTRRYKVSKKNLPLAKERKVIRRVKKRSSSQKQENRQVKQAKASKSISGAATANRQKKKKKNINTRNA